MRGWPGLTRAQRKFMRSLYEGGLAYKVWNGSFMEWQLDCERVIDVKSIISVLSNAGLITVRGNQATLSQEGISLCKSDANS